MTNSTRLSILGSFLIWLLIPAANATIFHFSDRSLFLPPPVQIVGYEYWFDQASNEAVFVAVSPTELLQLDLDLPTTGLPEGLHTLHIRFLDDQELWSSVISQFFTKVPAPIAGERQIVAYEYWFDAGYAQAVEVPVNPPVSDIVLNTDFMASNLPEGLHTLHMRFRDDQGLWSRVISQFFTKVPAPIAGERQIVAYEYWFDSGYTQAVEVQVNPPASGIVLNTDLMASNLPEGLHTLHMRFRDDQGLWSSVISQFFTKVPAPPGGERKVVAYEYWFDNGYAEVVEVPVTPPIAWLALDADLLLSNVAEGLHTIHLRFKDDAGKWSSVISQFFVKVPVPQSGERKIVAYEYWYDSAGAQTEKITVSPPVENLVLITDLPTPGLPVGEHTLYMRFKDDAGLWSSVTDDLFEVLSVYQYTFYADTDNDTYGDPAVTILGLTPPPGYVADNTDCDDTNPAIHPGATELCNGLDDNCDNIIDNNPPPAFIHPQNPMVCTGNGATLTASGGTSYLWSTGEMTATIAVNPVETTTYYVTVTDAITQCSAVAESTVTVMPVPDPGLPETMPSCDGSGATLIASNGFSFYQWSTGESGANLNSIFVNPAASETYSVTVTTSAGCIGSDAVTVNLAPAVFVTAASNVSEVCFGNSADLSASASGGTGAFTYSWSNGYSGPAQTVSPASTTIYSVTATDEAGCTASAAVTISVNFLDVSAGVSPPEGCPGSERVITLTPNSGTPPFVYQWDGGLPPESAQTVYPASTTLYSVSVTDANNCMGTLQIPVLVWQNAISANPATPVCPDIPVELSLAYGLASGAWSTGETSQSITVITPVTTTYSVNGIDVNGCPVDATYTVQISGDQPIGMFGSLSPIGGAINVPPNPVEFTWSPVPNAEQYDLFVWKTSESRPPNPNAGGWQAFMANVSLDFATQYNWQLRAWNDCHEAWSETVAFTTAELPDLALTNFTAPPSADYGQTIGLSWIVQNLGNAGTGASAWTDNVWLSVDTIISSNDILLGGWGNINYLNPTESYTQTRNANLPYGYYGVFHLIVETGAGIQEVLKTNNARVLPLTINIPPLPDLRVESVAAPTAAFGGDVVTLTWVVKNNGNLGATRDWYDQLYISGSNIFNSGDATFLGSRYAGGPGMILGPEETYSFSQTVQIPYTAYGEMWFHVVTDALNHEIELLENNNTGVTDQPIQVTLLPPPDLEPVSIIIPAAANSGQTVSVSFTVHNNGAANYPNQSAWLDKLYISLQPVFDNSAVFVGSAYHFGGIEAGGSYSSTVSFQIPNGSNGNYYVFVKADANNNVFEYNFENNNLLVSNGTINVSLTPSPDLFVSQILPSANAMTEQMAYTLFWKTKNIGNGNAPGLFREKVYLSQSPAWDGPNDLVSLGVFQRTGGLPAGDSMSYLTNFILPNLEAGGTWYFYVQTDLENDFYEHGGENNNISRSGAITVTEQFADLQILAFNAPATANSGSQISTSWQVRNTGTVPTGTGYWTDDVFVSVDAAISGDDLLLDMVVHNGILLPDSSYSASRSFILPNGLNGNYYLLLDAGHSPYEVNDNNPGNDFLAKPIAINLSPWPDLVVTDLTLPSPVIAGQSYWAHFSVKNNGTGPVNGQVVSDRVFLGSNPSLAGADDIGYKALPRTLAPGDTYVDSVFVTIPVYANGFYYLLMKTDNTNNVYEYIWENNNVFVGTIEGSGIGQQPIEVLPPSSTTVNLVMSGVSAPPAAFLGDPVTIEYEIQNASDTAVMGLVRDITYLSEDNIFDGATDRLQKYEDYLISLDEGASLQRSITAPLLSYQVGEHCPMARTNALNSITENTTDDNLGISATTIDVDAREFALDVPEVTALNVGDWDYYKFTVGPSLDILVTLKNLAGENNGRVFIGFNRVPTSDDYDFTDDNAAGTRTAVIPTCAAGTYFVLAQVKEPYPDQPQSEILVRALPFSIVSVTPDHVGQGVVTTTLVGAGFTPGTMIELRSGGSTAATGEITEFLHSMKMDVRWDLTEVPVGVYDVVGVKGAEVAVLVDGVVVEEAENLHLAIIEDLPSQMRVGRSYLFSFAIVNDGNLDIPIAEINIYTTGNGGSLTGFNKTENLLSWRDLADTTVVDIPYINPNSGTYSVSLLMSDVKPGEQGLVSFVVSGFSSGDLPVSGQAIPYFTSEFIQKQTLVFGRMRQALLQDPNLLFNDSELFALIQDEQIFIDSMFTPYLLLGLLDEEDFNNVPSVDIFDFSPGYGPGFSYHGNEFFPPGGRYLWEINLDKAQGGSAGKPLGWDIIHSTGQFEVTATQEDPFWIYLFSLNPCEGEFDFLTTWEPWHDYEWPIAIAENGFAGFAKEKFFLYDSLFGTYNSLYDGHFELEVSGDTMFLKFIHRNQNPGENGFDGGPGSCGFPGGNGGNGATGVSYQAGGKGGNGGVGGNGQPGGPGGNGGIGGNGGMGGFGANGGIGGDGGNGGIGGSNGVGGNGGQGGNGGVAGINGIDGNGGNGGNGGTGGDFSIGGIGGLGGIGVLTGESGVNGEYGSQSNPSSNTAQSGLDPECTCRTIIKSGLCFVDVISCFTNYGTCIAVAGATFGVLGIPCAIWAGISCGNGIVEDCAPLFTGTQCQDDPDDSVFDCVSLNSLSNEALAEFFSVIGYGGAITPGGYLLSVAKNCIPWEEFCLVVRVFVPVDPNDIIGPLGYDTTSRWVSKFDSLAYTVNFENDSTLATAAAQRVTVRVPIHENLNPLSLRLGDFGFAGMTFQVPKNKLNYTTVLDVAATLGVNVELSAGLDVVKNEAFWTFQAIDPLTGLPPAIPSAGFLPVNDALGRGQGFVNYYIFPKSSTITGDTATAQAEIVFDINDPIKTNVWKNTIDAFAPTSGLDPIPATTTSTSLPLIWNGADDPGGSGLEYIDLYVKENDGEFYLYKSKITNDSIAFTGQTGSTYCFYTRATDHVGNTEAPKLACEQTITMVEEAGDYQITISDPCNCLDNATDQSNGQFGETVQVTGPAGETWTVVTAQGLFQSGSPAPPASPLPIAAGAPLPEGPAGVYTLSGTHVDAAGYSLQVTNGVENLSISNTCYYPNPSLTGLSSEYCTQDGPQTVTVTAQLGDGSGQATVEGILFELIRLSDNSVVGSQSGTNNTFQFDPSTLQNGSHKLRVTFDALLDGPAHPGCIQSIEEAFLVKKVGCGEFPWDGN